MTGNNGAATFTQTTGSPAGHGVELRGGLRPGLTPRRDLQGGRNRHGTHSVTLERGVIVLVVTRNTLVQGAPLSATTSHGAAYSGQLHSTESGRSRWPRHRGSQPTVRVTSAFRARRPHQRRRGPCPRAPTASSGTESDALGDSGTWSFSVTVLGLQITTASLPTAFKGSSISGDDTCRDRWGHAVPLVDHEWLTTDGSHTQCDERQDLRHSAVLGCCEDIRPDDRGDRRTSSPGRRRPFELRVVT